MVLYLNMLLAAAATPCYDVDSVDINSEPVISYLAGNSDFGFAFNPSWIEASLDGAVPAGLIVRTQNCTVGYPPNGCGLQAPDGTHKCCACNMRNANASLQERSILTFTAIGAGGDGSTVAHPKFSALTKDSVVFEPVDQPPLNDDFRGTEDPRVAYDKSTGIYYMFYTCYRKDGKGGSLCLASTKNPVKGPWDRHGTAFPGNHKSGALLIRDEGPHFLISGAGKISMSNSTNLLNWTLGPDFITQTAWGNPHVEAGPPPMKLSDGNYVFFHNSWGGKGVPQPGYQPAWVILDGKDPTHILARAPKPLWRPDYYPWMAGNTEKGNLCNVPQVSFLEAAHVVEDKPDTFRLYYGGADAVLGTAIVTFKRFPDRTCE